MDITYQLSGYNPMLKWRLTYYAGDSLWELFKAYRKARREGVKYIEIHWHVPEPSE